MAYADNNFNRHIDNDDWLLIVPLLQGRGEGGVKGLAAWVAGGHCDGQWWQLQWWLFEQKRGWTRNKERRNWKMGLFFSCCLILLLFFGLSFSMQVNWFLPLLLRAAVAIMVKKRLVNSITFFHILKAVVVRRWQRGGRGGNGGSTAAATSFAAEGVAWWKRNFSGSSSAFGSAAALWWWRWWLLIVPLLWGRGRSIKS